MEPRNTSYDDKVLSHLHACELEILDDFLAVCRDEGLKYFGFAGTGIGALRHKGFIPWDDDIDIGLPSEDLDCLIRAVQKKYPEKYTMMSGGTDIRYPLPTVRMMLKNTKFRESALKDVDCELGIFLDLYGFDAIPDNNCLFFFQAMGAWFWAHLRMLKFIPDPVLMQHGILSTVIQAICRFVSKILNICNISAQRMYERELRHRNRYRGIETKRIAWMCDTSPFSVVFDRKGIEPFCVLEFEGRNLCFPNCLEKHLEDFYGDFMTLPPVESRKTHYPDELDFGHY